MQSGFSRSALGGAVFAILLGGIFLTNDMLNKGDQAGIAAEIIAIEEACLTHWCDGDPMAWVEVAADDIVYFDPFAEMRVTGKAAFAERMEGVKGKIHADHFELIDPLVQVGEDMAVLTFNYRSWNGAVPVEIKSSWNSTEVYKRIEGDWRLIQSHWSLTTPELKTD